MSGFDLVDPRYNALFERAWSVLGADPRVEQVEVGGSISTGSTDRWSDLDLAVGPTSVSGLRVGLAGAVGSHRRLAAGRELGPRGGRVAPLSGGDDLDLAHELVDLPDEGPTGQPAPVWAKPDGSEVAATDLAALPR
jgi:hypothetical protein